MKRTLYILFLFLWLFVPIGRANEVHDSIACGRWVTLTATPDSGYRFVRWSDGNEENPRRFYLEGDVDVVAEFEKDCDHASFPLQRVYDWILMLHADSLHAAGYGFEEKDVRWYRIVGGIDDPPGGDGDDMFLAEGYFFSMDRPLLGTGDYYAVIYPLLSEHSYLCDDWARSEVVRYTVPIGSSPERHVSLLPTYVQAGEEITLTGLIPENETEVRVYDISGRQMGRHLLRGNDRVRLRSEEEDGVYLVEVRDGENKWIFKYVAIR